jgi:hypothetical protein
VSDELKSAIEFAEHYLRDCARNPPDEAEEQMATTLRILVAALAKREAVAVLPRLRLIRIDTVSKTVRIEYVDRVGKETLSPLMPFDGTVAGLMAVLAASQQAKEAQA